MSSHPANQSSETGVQWQVDWNAALAAVNGSQSLLRELAAIFGSEGPRLQKQLEQALQEGDAPGLRIAAHTLKGSARYFGTNPVSELALKIEKLAMDEQLEAAEEPLRQLQTSLPLLLKAIQTIPEQASDA